MPLTTSLYTGLTGMQTNSQMLDVVGNNIANVNTNAFKKSRAQFETQISATLSSGSRPTADLGGTNPAQIGLGTRLAAIRRDFSAGGLQPTGQATDNAVEGAGFFIVEDGGSQRYTRDGAFALDRDFNLVTNGGARVQGYGVDGEFNVVEGVLESMNIPLGVLTIAEPTGEVNFAGNLNAGGDAATVGTIIQSQALFADAANTTAADGTTLLTSLFDDTSGIPLFATNDVLTVTGASKGGATLSDQAFTVSAADPGDGSAFGTTVQDILDFYNDVLGIDDTQPTGSVTIDAGGVINLNGNLGAGNDFVFDDGNAVNNLGVAPDLPFQFTKTQEADGESARTTFVIFDSLGEPLQVDLTLVLEEKTNNGTQWRFYAQSEDDTDLDRHMSSGVLNFNNEGQLVTTTDTLVTINRDNTGALTPQSFDLTFEDQFGSLTALFDVRSQINAISQDGTALGTLEDFSVSEDGTITGVFSNSLLRDLGRIPLALFSNPEGLLETGGNTYRTTPNSGDAIIVAAGSSGSGRVIGRALEISNVELSEEFINLISAQTGFSANSRVITTSQQLIQELLASIR
ncbi:MAG: flagellar hook-basal body complex protein [Planctomycetota bacterium]